IASTDRRFAGEVSCPALLPATSRPYSTFSNDLYYYYRRFAEKVSCLSSADDSKATLALFQILSTGVLLREFPRFCLLSAAVSLWACN
ncbi:hypothetical protein, partial [Pyrinomonas sp.]|uniref:hypothetical protein n=1 Tax=Pyrinomonas sp. TaxID=2080306 RepID=UPI0033313F42